MSSLPIPKNIKALGCRVLVYISQKPAKSRGGIELITPDTESMISGQIVALGDYAFEDMIKDPNDYLKVGDTVRFIKYAGTLVAVDGIEYRAMNDEDIFLSGDSDE